MKAPGGVSVVQVGDLPLAVVEHQAGGSEVGGSARLPALEGVQPTLPHLEQPPLQAVQRLHQRRRVCVVGVLRRIHRPPETANKGLLTDGHGHTDTQHRRERWGGKKKLKGLTFGTKENPSRLQESHKKDPFIPLPDVYLCSKEEKIHRVEQRCRPEAAGEASLPSNTQRSHLESGLPLMVYWGDAGLRDGENDIKPDQVKPTAHSQFPVNHLHSVTILLATPF